MTPRYWDGFVRSVVSARHVNASNNNVRVRVELLSCGHEQAFCGNKASHGGSKGAKGSRVCNTCSDLGRRGC